MKTDKITVFDLFEKQRRFLDTYNTLRPHMGINMLTPKEAIVLYHML